MACTYSLEQLLRESPMATGSLKGASCQDPRDCRDNVQIQAEGGSHSSYRGVACGAGGFLPCVCLSGLLRKPQKHSARGRLQIWLSATCRGHQYQARMVTSSFPSHPYRPGAARRHSTQSREGHGQTPQHEASPVGAQG